MVERYPLRADRVETLIFTSANEGVHYEMYGGADWSNASSTTPTI